MHIFDLDESNNCYRSYSTRTITYPNRARAQAYSHFTYDNLVNNYHFVPIKDDKLEYYEKLHYDYMEFTIWQSRSDGHGGSKGGTRADYNLYKEQVKRYEKTKDI